jgi:hypothetical protein
VVNMLRNKVVSLERNEVVTMKRNGVVSISGFSIEIRAENLKNQF